MNLAYFPNGPVINNDFDMCFPQEAFVFSFCKVQIIEDIWWKNYCMDEQTSTHPTQIQ